MTDYTDPEWQLKVLEREINRLNRNYIIGYPAMVRPPVTKPINVLMHTIDDNYYVALYRPHDDTYDLTGFAPLDSSTDSQILPADHPSLISWTHLPSAEKTIF